MKFSEITIKEIKEYLRIDDEEEDRMIEIMLTSSKTFIKNYTNLTEEELDECEDISMAVFVLCADMYDNRQFTMDKVPSINPTIKLILNLYLKHSLGGVADERPND